MKLNEEVLKLARRTAHRQCPHGQFARDEVDDIVHDLLLHLAEQAHRHDPRRGEWAAFAARTMKHRCIDLVRARRRRLTHECSAPEGVGCLPGEIVHEAGAECVLLERAEVLHDVCAGAPAADVEVCRLLPFATVAEIAVALGRPYSTIADARRRCAVRMGSGGYRREKEGLGT